MLEGYLFFPLQGKLVPHPSSQLLLIVLPHLTYSPLYIALSEIQQYNIRTLYLLFSNFLPKPMLFPLSLLLSTRVSLSILRTCRRLGGSRRVGMECDVMLMRFFFKKKNGSSQALPSPSSRRKPHCERGDQMPGARVGSSPSNQYGPRLGLITCQRNKVQEGLGLSSIVMSHSARDATPARIFHFVSKILITWREARRTASPFFFCPQFFLPFSGSLPFPRPSLRSVGPPVTLSNKRKRRRPVQPASQPVSQPVPI